jgi:hypothetical protein
VLDHAIDIFAVTVGVAAAMLCPYMRPSTPFCSFVSFRTGTSQVGTETHFGLGARDGRLIMSATHAGDIPVTPENSNSLISLGGVELTTAKEILGP